MYFCGILLTFVLVSNGASAGVVSYPHAAEIVAELATLPSRQRPLQLPVQLVQSPEIEQYVSCLKSTIGLAYCKECPWNNSVVIRDRDWPVEAFCILDIIDTKMLPFLPRPTESVNYVYKSRQGGVLTADGLSVIDEGEGAAYRPPVFTHRNSTNLDYIVESLEDVLVTYVLQPGDPNGPYLDIPRRSMGQWKTLRPDGGTFDYAFDGNFCPTPPSNKVNP